MKPSKAVGMGCDRRCAGWVRCPSAPRVVFGRALLGCLLSLGYAANGNAQDASELQAQIERQRAENQALKDKIEQFERVLKTDVCKNPDAAKLLDEEPPAAPPPEPAAPPGK
ncbi:hypothetical protein [Methylotetracoccus oryzae]|uniref:hypothetical protein n=1 Tax=Methylotetracoccus oryzae TaxID=1919059 RepID=UPI001118C197|nr:hypothetical protein [Methylotetracoccus oryzae]